MKRLEIPVTAKIAIMISALIFGGAYLLLGQQIPSEESDWPWKIVTESKLFLNASPAGKLSDPAALANKLGLTLDQARRAGKVDPYESAPVLVALDPDTAIGRLEQIEYAIIEGTGEAVYVKRSTLENTPSAAKPNPGAFVVSTENVDPEKIKRLMGLPGPERLAAGNRFFFVDGSSAEMLKFSRTYESSIEVGSDGRFYFNERTGKRNAPGANLATRVTNPMWEQSNSNQPPRGNVRIFPPVMPLKQRPLDRRNLAEAVTELVAAADPKSPAIYVIASEKARYESLLDIMEAVGNSNVTLVITVRRVAGR